MLENIYKPAISRFTCLLFLLFFSFFDYFFFPSHLICYDIRNNINRYEDGFMLFMSSLVANHLSRGLFENFMINFEVSLKKIFLLYVIRSCKPSPSTPIARDKTSNSIFVSKWCLSRFCDQSLCGSATFNWRYFNLIQMKWTYLSTCSRLHHGSIFSLSLVWLMRSVHGIF